MHIGQHVIIKNSLPRAWFGKTYPEELKGTVTKVFANGKLAVRIAELNKVQHFTERDFV